MVDIFRAQNSDSEDELQLRDLLREACNVPPVSDALLRRLDQNVEAVWGGSPRLRRSQAGPVRRVLLESLDRVSSRTVRAWSLTTVATVACIVTFLFVTRDRYSWAAMIDRLQKESVVRITEEGLNKIFFISPNDEVIAERTRTGTRVTDFRRRVKLDYRAGDEVVVRSPLDGTDSRPSAEFVWFLLPGVDLPGDNTSMVVESESWSRVVHDGRRQIELRTQLSCDNGAEPIQVVSLLDPETHFPSAIEVQTERGTTRRLSFDRMAGDDTVLSVAGLPGGLPVVESGEPRNVATPSLAMNPDSASSVGASATLTSGVGTAASAVSNGPKSSVASNEVVTGSINLSWNAVVPVSASAEEVAAETDRLLLRAWRETEIEPVALADSGELMRRIYLDLTGRIPTTSEVRDFEAVRADPGAADALVDQLVESADHASHVASVWRSFLIPEEAEFDASGDTASFEEWFADQLMSHVSYDQIVRSLLVAEGRLAESGPLLFYSAAKLEPEKLAGRSARAFLGMRLECAQCHDDPFEPWTLSDFWSFAAYFARISRPQGPLEMASPVLLVQDVDWGDVKLPETDTIVAPRLLDGTSAENDESRSRRQQLAQWLTARENPFFARATVNRVWSLMFGRGIVDPVDGFGALNQADVPEVLDLLAGYFIASDFDLRALYRAIAKTNAYRLSSGGDIDSGELQRWFAQMHVKVLSAGQLYDSIAVATLLESGFVDDSNLLTVDRVGNPSRERFVRQFASPTMEATAYQGGIPLALTLMNGNLIKDATGIENSGLLNALRAPFFSSEQRVRALFLATVSREPTAAEWELCRSHMDEGSSASDETNRLADILWALLNSAEFTMNH